MNGWGEMQILHDSMLPVVAVTATLVDAPPVPARVEADVANAWQRLQAHAHERGVTLFDGPTVRVIDWSTSADGAAPGLSLRLTRSTYRYKAVALAGDDRAVSDAIDLHGLDRTLACAAVLRTTDDRLVLPLRAARVPAAGRWHLVAGHPEAPADTAVRTIDLGAEAEREVVDELGIDRAAIRDWTCMALLGHPAGGPVELVFGARLDILAADLHAAWHAAPEAFEHDELATPPATAATVTDAIAHGIPDRTGVRKPLTRIAQLALERWRVLEAARTARACVPEV